MTRWFRMYDELVDDPKVQRLPAPLFKAWVNLLCIASRNGGILPSMDDIAFLLRMTPVRAAEVIEALTAAGLIDASDDAGELCLKPHNWDSRQFRSDVSTPRVKRFRKRQRNVSLGVSETPPETETETETERTPTSLRSVGERGKPRSEKPGRRLPADWQPDPNDLAFADSVLPADRVRIEIEKFRDYWHAANGPPAVKRDWAAAWRNWCRKAAEMPVRRGPQHGHNRGGGFALVAAEFAFHDAQRRADHGREGPPGPVRDGSGSDDP